MVDLTINSCPTSFHTFQSRAPSDDSLSGGVVETGTLASGVGQFGRGVTALLSELKLL